MKRLTVIVVLIVAVAGGGWVYLRGRGDPTVGNFRTAAVKKGELISTIGATGTLEPEEVIDVGAQVAGQILEFGKDRDGKSIDYRSKVEEGMVLARIDDSLYQADAALAQASLDSAKAGVTRAKADVESSKAKLDQAKRDWDRAQKLDKDALAQSQFDAYKSGYDTAVANVGVSEAAVGQAEAAIGQANANLQRSQRNLSYTIIKSPVKGEIIDRRVNIGQTVVASLNAPSLFLIAKDLTRMQVWVSVNEADIGSIYSGQPVTFTVDAYPGQTFRGEVGKPRLNATMTQNVVTYTVEVLTDNSDGKLLPYLTANVLFETARRSDVLSVPNAALRWFPRDEQVAEAYRGDLDGLRRMVSSGRGGRGGSGDSAASQPTGRHRGADSRPTDTASTSQPATSRPTSRSGRGGPTMGVIWVPEGSLVRPVKVQVGMTDGASTEVQAADLAEGQAVVIGEEVAAAAPSGGTTGTPASPFLPQLPRRGGGSAGGQGGGGQGGGAGGGGAGGGGGSGGGGGGPGAGGGGGGR